MSNPISYKRTHDRDAYASDDSSSSLSIPNESIDFDQVYSLHNFAATVEGQASVVKSENLVLMDDSNSYWWLVRVPRTQEVGYIPAENIETAFGRLGRLNKHLNIDVCAPSQPSIYYILEITRVTASFGYTRRDARQHVIMCCF